MEETSTSPRAPTGGRGGARTRTLGLVTAGLLAGGALGLTGIASAAGSTPAPSPGSSGAPSGHHCNKGAGGSAGQGADQAPSAPSGGTSSGTGETGSNV